MLKEIIEPRQNNGETRRVFSDEYFDLYVWYENTGNSISGFQLCYDKGNFERCLDWRKVQGYNHFKVDNGEDPGFASFKMKPVLEPCGKVDTWMVLEKFKMSGASLEKDLCEFIINKIGGSESL